jgi:hypothetical protein
LRNENIDFRNRLTVKTAIAQYLDFKKSKARNTVTAYRTALTRADVLADLNVRFLDGITVDVLVKQPRTIGGIVRTGEKTYRQDKCDRNSNRAHAQENSHDIPPCKMSEDLLARIYITLMALSNGLPLLQHPSRPCDARQEQEHLTEVINTLIQCLVILR